MMAPEYSELRDARAGPDGGVALTSTDEKRLGGLSQESVQWDPCIPQLTPSPGLDYFCEWPRRLSPRRFGRRLGRSSPRKPNPLWILPKCTCAGTEACAQLDLLQLELASATHGAIERVSSCVHHHLAPLIILSEHRCGHFLGFLGTFLDTSDSDTHPQAHR